MEITNRQILITGAGRGIGRAFAKMCAQDKAFLHIVLRQKDETIVKELEEAGARAVTVYEADLSSPQDIKNLLEQLKSTPIDILFNNAGVLTGGLLETQPIEDIYKMFQVNINALVQLTQGILPGMLSRRRGKIINNASVAAYMNTPCASTYSASKAAVVAFTNCLHLELKDTGVSTLLLVTPPVKTRMYSELETLYGKNFELPNDSLSPTKFVEMIREAILHDLSVLEPSGFAGIGLKIARYAKPIFDLEVSRRFRR
ncbi:MAG TPA: SDR family NAD(P)-dependent oxidoreductase [Bdellovibrio sp.]|nr:SDR family NAD(P)-dependent oxidoreductase [Bdellovibrio sp.]